MKMTTPKKILHPIKPLQQVNSRRLEWIDSAKGFAIFLVVLGHTWDGMGNRGLIEPSLHQLIYDHIYVYHMPFFFMLSGFFVSGSFFATKPLPFARNQFWQMIYPMVLWYYIFLSAKIVAGGFANEAGHTSMLLELPIPGAWHYWFLWALMLMRVSIYIMRPILSNDRYFTPSLLALFVVLCLIETLPQSEWVIVWASPAIHFGPYFIVGILIGKYHDRIQPTNFNAGLAGIIFVLIALLVLYLTKMGIPKLPIAMLMCLCSIYVFKWLGNYTNKQSNGKSGWMNTIMKWLAIIGVLSMPIFLAHPIFSSITREGLVLSGITNISIQLIIGTTAGIICSLLMYHISVKLKLDVALGFNLPKAK